MLTDFGHRGNMRHMGVFRIPDTYNVRYGITPRHFRIFQEVATTRKAILLVRGGKKAAIPWIERGFPAKPMFLKAKVDSTLGLLKLGPEAPRFAAYHNLCYVVDAEARGTGLVANCPDHPTRKCVPLDFTRLPWSEFGSRRSELKGLVLEEKSLLPYTSDYDLGAVLPVGSEFSVATYAAPPRSWQYDFQKNLSSPLVESVADELNRLMNAPDYNRRTGPRVLHGANAQYSGSPAYREDEPILVFWPRNRVESFAAPSVAAAAKVMREIWEESSNR